MDEQGARDGTGQGLIDFFTWVISKGQMNKNTAGAMRAAVREVLNVEGDDPARIDVRSLDVDDLAHRFGNLRKEKFNPQSLGTYQQRFRKAVEMYLAYLDNPAGWRPSIRERASSLNGDRLKPGTPDSPKPSKSTAGLMEFPFPLRDGVIAQLHLPVDLRKSEVKRLAAFIDSLAIEEQRALPPGEGNKQEES
jgi:hypothetical protein